MKKGILYGISLGPGDPDLITVKGAAILGSCRHVFVPRGREGSENAVLAIAGKHLNIHACIHEIIFPTSTDPAEVEAAWRESAPTMAELLESGEDVCLIARGNILLYSTYNRFLRVLRRHIPDVDVVTIPGITPFGAAAALTNFPLGRAKEPIVILPGADDLEAIRRSLSQGSTLILMNVGRRLGGILDVLEAGGAIARSVFVSRAGMEDQFIETDLRNLRGQDAEVHHLSTILIRSKADELL
jgi:precorrin-2/cobalt-factor-2 C20-methyltransferase